MTLPWGRWSSKDSKSSDAGLCLAFGVSLCVHFPCRQGIPQRLLILSFCAGVPHASRATWPVLDTLATSSWQCLCTTHWSSRASPTTIVFLTSHLALRIEKGIC